jgi:hypothetical protein
MTTGQLVLKISEKGRVAQCNALWKMAVVRCEINNSLTEAKNIMQRGNDGANTS